MDCTLDRTSKIRVAIHAHFFYPELASDFLCKIGSNNSRCDLLISTTEKAKMDQIYRRVQSYDRGDVSVRIVPNRGRDMGAFLTSFANDVLEYDVIGHLHSKRSLYIGDPTLGESWREFLWQHLLGSLFPMMDIIVEHFANDDRLGIVFPEELRLTGWDLNQNIAACLAKRLGIEIPLWPFFDFPVGTMFWARPRALRSLFELNLDWQDYPEEPIPIDGTILHALERLLPLVAQNAGYRYATTHIAGVTW
jgi:lipopolysaccharide biosynthesis protein